MMRRAGERGMEIEMRGRTLIFVAPLTDFSNEDILLSSAAQTECS
jgi:hypothetical protein